MTSERWPTHYCQNKNKKKNTKQVPKITWGLLCSTQVAGTHSPRSQDRGWRQQPGRACVQDKAWWFGFSNTQLYLQQSTRTSHVPSSPLFRTQGLPWWLTSGPTNATPAVSRSWYSVLQRKNTTTRHHAAVEQLVRRGGFLLIPLPFDIGVMASIAADSDLACGRPLMQTQHEAWAYRHKLKSSRLQWVVSLCRSCAPKLQHSRSQGLAHPCKQQHFS